MNAGIAVALIALVVFRLQYGLKLRFPPLGAPLAAFFVWTVLAILFSGHIAEGWEGVRKFYLFLMLPIVVSTVRSHADVRRLVWGLTVGATLSAGWSLVQFARKY